MQTVYFKLDNATTASGSTQESLTHALTLLRLASLSEPEPVQVKLVLPHKRHLVPVQQEAKNREQLKAWGLRR